MTTEAIFTAAGCSCRANVLDFCPFTDYIVYAAAFDIVLVGIDVVKNITKNLRKIFLLDSRNTSNFGNKSSSF